MKKGYWLARLWGLWALCSLAACGGMRTAPVSGTSLTPGAAACSAAALTNPAADPSGLGGTGARAARGPDPGGIGGTGSVATGSGLGGTGRPLQAGVGNGLGGTGSPLMTGQEGLGGTGIVGVVTGFASICVNGVEVEYEPNTPVERDGQASPISDLAVGQLVALQAVGQGDQLRASRIAVLDAAVGPLTALDTASGRFEVMGQAGTALERDDLVGLMVGDWVRVSGQRLSSGDIRATRVQRASAGQATVTGPFSMSGTQGVRVGNTPLTVSTLPAGLVEGQEVGVRGQWIDGRLKAQEVRARPTHAAVGGSREVLLQGYVHSLRGRELQLGYESLTLSEQVRIDGGDLSTLRVDQAVQVRGRMDAQSRVTVERLEFRREGRRGEARPSSTATVARPAAAAAGDDSAGSNSGKNSGNASSGGSSDGGQGRGRGRGRGGSDGGGSNSGSGSSGSGSSGSGSSGSGSSGSGSSGSGSSGSGSSGSGSSGSGSSGSGSSGSGSSGSGSSGSGSSGSGSSGSGSSGSGSSGSGSSGSGSSGSGSSGSGSSGSGSSGSSSSGSGDSGKGRGRGRGGKD